MFILAAVTISIAINGGLFKQAQSAVDQTRQKQEDELATIDELANVYGSIKVATGGTVTLSVEELDKYIDDKIKAAQEESKAEMYPVGSIYMSVDSTNPSALFGGTWVAWRSGKSTCWSKLKWYI